MLLLALVTLVLAPWRGASLPTATPHAAAYKLTVHGTAGQHVALRAGGLPSGWVASFCTPELCSPFEYDMVLNDRGAGIIEFQAIRTDDSAPRHVKVTVTAPGAKPLDVRI